MRQVTARWGTAQPLAPCNLPHLLCEGAWLCCLPGPHLPPGHLSGRADGWGRAVWGGIILAEELFPSEHLSTEGDGGWRDAGSAFRVGVKLRIQQLLREGPQLAHKAREGPPAVMILGCGGKKSLEECLQDSLCRVVRPWRTAVNSLTMCVADWDAILVHLQLTLSSLLTKSKLATSSDAEGSYVCLLWAIVHV